MNKKFFARSIDDAMQLIYKLHAKVTHVDKYPIKIKYEDSLFTSYSASIQIITQ